MTGVGPLTDSRSGLNGSRRGTSRTRGRPGRTSQLARRLRQTAGGVVFLPVAVLYRIAAALPVFARQKTGHIINLSSVAGDKVTMGGAVYHHEILLRPTAQER